MVKTWAYSMQIKYTRNNYRIRVESLGYHSKSVKCKPNKKKKEQLPEIDYQNHDPQMTPRA